MTLYDIVHVLLKFVAVEPATMIILGSLLRHDAMFEPGNYGCMTRATSTHPEEWDVTSTLWGGRFQRRNSNVP